MGGLVCNVMGVSHRVGLLGGHRGCAGIREWRTEPRVVPEISYPLPERPDLGRLLFKR